MSDEWEEFLGGPRSRASEPQISLSPRAELSLNRAAIELLGNPMSVVMLFDRARSRIGLRPSPNGAPNAYRLKHRRSDKRSRPSIVHLKAFCNTYNIRPKRSIRFATPQSENGMLVLDLPGYETG
ncbi:MAG: hypothetical protein ABI878_14700 [Acidobacteriota bacterium]